MTDFSQFAEQIIDKAQLLQETQSTFIIVDDNLNIRYINTKEVTQDTSFCVKPGDFLHCKNAMSSEHGCGTSQNCACCKLRNTVKHVFRTNTAANEEVVLSTDNNQKLVIQGNMTPFDFNGNHYVAILVLNRGEQVRAGIMDRIFFHDMLNLAGALNGLVEMMSDTPDPLLIGEVKKLTNQIVEELCQQRDLSHAEGGRLHLDLNETLLSDFLSYSQPLLNSLAETHERQISVECEADDQYIIYTDYKILHRVLLNMVKNAEEASASHEVVQIKVKTEGDKVVFSVHNSIAIPKEIQPEVFLYGISSKGTGHGLGTYSMKLFGENYLQGTVWFHSNETDGTTFYLRIPQRILELSK